MARPANELKEQRATGSSDSRSIGELFAELTRETSTLVRQEIDLAKKEMTSKATTVGKDIGFLLAGAAVAYAGFLALIAAVIIIVAHALPWWAAALLVGLVVTGIGGFLVMRGVNELKQTSVTPEVTVGTLKEDAQWAKDQTK